MSNHDEAEKIIENITSVMNSTVERAKNTLGFIGDLSEAFEDIETAFSEVVDVLDQMNERIARLERMATEQ